jgi:hypothetical protein
VYLIASLVSKERQSVPSVAHSTVKTAVSGDAYVVLLVDTPGAEQHASKAIDVLLL